MAASKIIGKLKEKQKKKTAKSKLLDKIENQFTAEELKTILASGKLHVTPTKPQYPKIDFGKDVFKIGVISDTHIGSIWYHAEWLKKAFEQFNKVNVDIVTHSGDVVDGLSNRPGQVYELDYVGYAQQKKYAIEQFNIYNTKKIPMYLIDGNHDRWYIKNSGSLIVEDIVKEFDFEAEFLGHDSGNIVVDSADIMLWHGEDGSSYATSYRLQKVIEAFTGGEKPDVLIAGHTHKQGYFFERHVQVVSAGAMCSQSSWMKSKRLANHSGFWIVELGLNYKGVGRCSVEWFPFYG